MSKPFFKTFIGNLVIIIALCIALYWIFFGSLSILTKHNDVRVVPDLVGLSAKEAVTLLEKEGYEIKVDSVYDNGKKLNVVIDQQPEKGAKVKSGRIIFLTINKSKVPTVEVPNLKGMSLRNALLVLKKSNLKMGDTTYVFDEAEGTVLEVKIKGKEVLSGTIVPEGSALDFVISKGLSDEQVGVPEVIGLTLDEAKKLIEEKELHCKYYFEGAITDSSTALVFTQYPEARNEYGEPLRVNKGQSIDIRIKQNPAIEKKQYKKRPVEYSDSAGSMIPGTSNPGEEQNNNEQGQGNTPPKKVRPTRPSR